MITRVKIYNDSFAPEEYVMELSYEEFAFLIKHCNQDINTFYDYGKLTEGWKPMIIVCGEQSK